MIALNSSKLCGAKRSFQKIKKSTSTKLKKRLKIRDIWRYLESIGGTGLKLKLFSMRKYVSSIRRLYLMKVDSKFMELYFKDYSRFKRKCNK